MRTTCLLGAGLLAVGLASAARGEGLAITPNLNLPQGLGADLTYRLAPRVNLRLGGALPVTGTAEDFEFGDVKYDMKLKLGGLNAFVDWHPFAGNFHVSGGLVTLRRPWSLEAASTSTYKINGVSYPASGVGRLSGQLIPGNRVSPALAFGWGNPVRPGKRLGAVLDLGLAYAGKQELRLTADGPLAGDPGFGRDLAAEMAEHSNDHSLWLFARVGISYQF